MIIHIYYIDTLFSPVTVSFYFSSIAKLRFVNCCTNKRIWINEWITDWAALLWGSYDSVYRERKCAENYNIRLNTFIFKTAIGILLTSNHNSFSVLFHRIALVYFVWKINWYSSIGNDQHREPALCQLYRHTFVPYCYRCSVAVSVCLSVTTMSCTKAAEPIEMSHGVCTWVRPRNYLFGGPDPQD